MILSHFRCSETRPENRFLGDFSTPATDGLTVRVHVDFFCNCLTQIAPPDSFLFVRRTNIEWVNPKQLVNQC